MGPVMRSLTVGCLAVLCTTTSLIGQFLTLPAGPVAPGSTISGNYHNNTAAIASHPMNNSPVSLLHHDGELITPRFHVNQGTLWLVTYPGVSEWFQFTAPSSGPGSSGSFVLLYGWTPAAVGRLDVGVVSPAFPSIHAFSPTVHLGFGTHAVTFGSPAFWSVGNTSGAPFTFGAADTVQVFAPGGATPLASQSIAGISVAPGAVAAVPIPIAGLVPGPYTIAISWNDPVAGPLVRRFGIHEAAYADLYVPSGKVLPFGGSVSMFTNGLVLGGGPLSFAVIADMSSGSTGLPTGQFIPLVLDPVAQACLTSSLFGLLVNGQGTATALPSTCYGYCAPGGRGPFITRYVTPTTTLFHPNVPGLTGLVVRVATLLFDFTGGRWVATQGEEIVIG